jgi:hypothetical protein
LPWDTAISTKKKKTTDNKTTINLAVVDMEEEDKPRLTTRSVVDYILIDCIIFFPFACEFHIKWLQFLSLIIALLGMGDFYYNNRKEKKWKLIFVGLLWSTIIIFGIIIS